MIGPGLFRRSDLFLGRPLSIIPEDSDPPRRWPLAETGVSAVAGGVSRPSQGFGEAVRDSKMGAETGVGIPAQDVPVVEADLGEVKSGSDELGVVNGVRLRGDESARPCRRESFLEGKWLSDCCRLSLAVAKSDLGITRGVSCFGESGPAEFLDSATGERMSETSSSLSVFRKVSARRCFLEV